MDKGKNWRILEETAAYPVDPGASLLSFSPYDSLQVKPLKDIVGKSATMATKLMKTNRALQQFPG